MTSKGLHLQSNNGTILFVSFLGKYCRAHLTERSMHLSIPLSKPHVHAQKLLPSHLAEFAPHLGYLLSASYFF